MKIVEETFGTIAEYPELKSYLEEKLSELGDFTITNAFSLPDDCSYIVEIVFYEYPKVFNWKLSENRFKNYLYINSDAGGCGLHGLVNCFLLPKSNNKNAKFRFSLELDSRCEKDIYNSNILKERVDKFVRLSKNVFCYHFGGAYDR